MNANYKSPNPVTSLRNKIGEIIDKMDVGGYRGEADYWEPVAAQIIDTVLDEVNREVLGTDEPTDRPDVDTVSNGIRNDLRQSQRAKLKSLRDE
jgi:hypothetical protein